MIRADNLRKTYPSGVAALDGVSLEIEAGEFIAVCGASGCGKSTLLLTLGGLLKPDGGTVSIAGEEPYAVGSQARARFRAEQIGFVFQNFHLVPYLDVFDNVIAPTLANPIDGGKKRAEQLLEELGLADRRKHRPSALSAGEQQRVALARALLTKPTLVLADEPTGNLDSENSAHVLDHLGGYAAGGASVLMVTHDKDAMAAANRRLEMNQGKIQPA